jgi:hypothetical protein
MSLLRVNFLIVLMLLIIGLTSDQLTSYMLLWLLFLLIADLILVRLKVRKDRKAEEVMRKYEPLNVENQYGGET